MAQNTWENRSICIFRSSLRIISTGTHASMARWVSKKHTYIPVDLTWAMTVFAFDHLSSAFVLYHWSKEEVALSIRSCFLPERLWWVPHSSLKPVRICLSLSTVLSLILCRIAYKQLRKKGMKWELQRTSKSDQDSVLPMSQGVGWKKANIGRKKASQARVLTVECDQGHMPAKQSPWLCHPRPHNLWIIDVGHWGEPHYWATRN